MEGSVSLWGRVRKSRDEGKQWPLMRGSHNHTGVTGPPLPKGRHSPSFSHSYFTSLDPYGVRWWNRNLLSISLATLQGSLG